MRGVRVRGAADAHTQQRTQVGTARVLGASEGALAQGAAPAVPLPLATQAFAGRAAAGVWTLKAPTAT